MYYHLIVAKIDTLNSFCLMIKQKFLPICISYGKASWSSSLQAKLMLKLIHTCLLLTKPYSQYQLSGWPRSYLRSLQILLAR